MSRTNGEALKNLRLDATFFHRVLQKDGGVVEGAAPDYDIYLMEQGVMPLLLQGLDALSRHVDKLGQGGGLSGGGKAPFNPLTWLAQYLLRNHPSKIRDHRTPIYQRLGEMANVERGRRGLLRRRQQMEEEWEDMVGNQGRLTPAELPQYLSRLDDRWNLEGAFVGKLPGDLVGVVCAPSVDGDLAFSDFWLWFEGYVGQHDVLRASAFDIAARRKEEAERQAKQAEEEMARLEKVMHEVLELRRGLEDQFASNCADMYTDEVITQIINKGAVVQGTREQEGGPPLQGVHIELIISMLRLWGFPADPPPADVWNDAALAAWQLWLETYGPDGSNGHSRVDSANLRRLMDRDAFQAFLIQAYPAPEYEVGTETQHTVEVRNILVTDDIDVFVEAVDEETGQTRQLVLPEGHVEEVRRRLAESSGGPVLARVDLVSHRVTTVLPS